MNTWKDLVPIVQALAEGKSIQYQRGDGDWSDTSGHVIYKDQEYRIRPEPRELYVVYYNNGICSYPCETLQAAENLRASLGYFQTTTIVKFREVTDES